VAGSPGDDGLRLGAALGVDVPDRPLTSSSSPRASTRARWTLWALFFVLLLAFAAGIWGTVVRPPAYEVKGEVVARAGPGLLIVRHEAASALGMAAMELMAVEGEPALFDATPLAAGDRVRLAVRAQGDRISVVWIEKLQ
jgi:hypothetical protein